MPLLKIANEHHGSTVLQYFWRKACREAEMKGLSPPSADAFRYRTPLPSSRESAIVMLADSTEAAMRSEGIDKLDRAEQLIRNVIKVKIDQDQLKNSGLSFADIEKIIQSFLQIYAGHFHERVAYSEQNKPTAPEPERESAGIKDTFVKETTMPVRIMTMSEGAQIATGHKDITTPVHIASPEDVAQTEYEQKEGTFPIQVSTPEESAKIGRERRERTMPIRVITPGEIAQKRVGRKDRTTPVRIVTERKKDKSDQDD
jgi:multidrug efflux pump subunit AcrB